MNVNILILIACAVICGLYGLAIWSTIRVAAMADASPAGDAKEGVAQ